MEKLLRQVDYAKHRGLSRQRISALKKEGRIVMVGRLVDVAATDQLLDATESGLPQHQARKATAQAENAVKQAQQIQSPAPDEKDQQSATDSASTAQTGDTLERVGLDLKIAQKRKAEADAEKAEMEAGAMRKELVPIDDVMSAVNDVFTVLRVSVGAIPDKYSAQLAAEPDEARVHSLLGAEIDAVLTHAANMVDEGFA